MRREVSISIFAVLIIAAAILTVYYLNVGPTGFAVLSDYTNETSCLTAGHTWENLTEQNCTIETTCINQTTDCEPCLGYEDLNGTQGNCIDWSSCVGENCTDEETCVDIVTGGQCVGDVCGSGHLNLCLNETACSNAEGYWRDSQCNAEPAACSPKWDCNTWSNCSSSGAQKRTCTDGNSCGITTGKPSENRSCTPPSESALQETVETTPTVTEVSLGGVSAQDINQGNSGQFTVPLQNTGTVPVTSCLLKGDDSGWFSITGGAINLNTGEESSLSFSLNVPEATSPGEHTLGLSVDCAEATTSQTITVNVLQKKLNFNITNVQRTREDRVRVDYSLTELAGEDQDVEIYFSIKDASGLEVANASQNRSIGANKTDDFRTNIQINETLEGNLTLSAAFNSQVYSSSVLEPISLGAPIGGFAIFEGVGGAGGVIILVVVVLILVVIFFIARKMRKSGKDLGDLLGGSKE